MLLAAWLWVCPSPLRFGFMSPESHPSVQTTSSSCGYHRASSSSAGQLMFVTPGPAQGSPPLHSPIVSSCSPGLAQWPVCCSPGAWVRLSRNDPVHVFGSPTWNCRLLEGKGPFLGSLPLSLSLWHTDRSSIKGFWMNNWKDQDTTGNFLQKPKEIDLLTLCGCRGETWGPRITFSEKQIFTQPWECSCSQNCPAWKGAALGGVSSQSTKVCAQRPGVLGTHFCNMKAS